MPTRTPAMGLEGANSLYVSIMLSGAAVPPSRHLLHEQQKRPGADPQVSFVELGTSEPVRRPGFSNGLLNRLGGVARQTGIHLTELRELGNVSVIAFFAY